MKRIIELSFNNREDVITLPINPTSIEFSEMQLNQKLTLLNIGEINLIGHRGLVNTSFSSFFPATTSPHYKRAAMSPAAYVALLKKWKLSGKPIRVIITDMEINLAMTIERLATNVIEGTGDINYTIDLAEYRFLNVPQVKPEKTQTQSATTLDERPDTKEQPKSYTVKSGDSLWAIAKKTLGNGSRYTDIYSVNQRLIDDKNGNKMPKYTIYTGQSLVIPA